MKKGDWVQILKGNWKNMEGEVFIGTDRFSWVRLLNGEEVLCLPDQIRSLPVLGQTSLLNLQGDEISG